MTSQDYLVKRWEKNEPFYHGGLLLSATTIFDTFSWRIPNISSIPHEVDYVVESPPFFSDGATWILKMYPYGQTIRKSEGYIDFILERLESSFVKQELRIHMFCKDVTGKVIKSVNKSYLFMSGAATEFREHNFIQNLKDSPDKDRIAPNDTFILVCEIGKYMSISGKNLQNKSSEHNKGERRNRNSRNPEIGEISREYSHSKHFPFKICDVAVVPDDYHLCEQLLLANAIWDLKIYPYFRMKNSSRPCFDVVLERVQTEVPEHNIDFEIKFLSDNPAPQISEVERSFFFNENQIQGEAITFHLKEEGGFICTKYCFHFDVCIRNKWNAGRQLNLPSKSTDPGCNSVSLSAAKAVSTDLKEFFLKQEGCDATIIVKGKEFQAHRAILSARSAVFASTFRIDMTEKDTGVVKINDCEPSSFSDFLIFLYSGNVELSTENAYSLFVTADKYDVQDLRLQCLEFIKNNVSLSTFCKTITLALQYSDEELMQLSTEFLAKNLLEVLMTVEWQSLAIENPIVCNELTVKALKSNKN